MASHGGLCLNVEGNGSVLYDATLLGEEAEDERVSERESMGL